MEQKPSKLNIPSKEEIKEIMKTPGKIKGTSFNGDLEYILEKKGEEGLKLVEKETARLGYPIEYKKIKETEWYPVGLRVVSLTAILNTFNWGKKELTELAEAATKVSFIVRLFMKYFVSTEKVFRASGPRMWKRYFNTGSLEAVDFKESKEGGYGIVRLTNFKLHPLYCLYLGHFFVGIGKLSEPRAKEMWVKETKCVFRGDPYHEYLIEWIY